MPDSWRPHGLQPTRLLCPWDFPGKDTLEWVSIPFSKGSSQPRDQTQVSCTAGRFFTDWATREAQSYLGDNFVKSTDTIWALKKTASILEYE